MVLKVQKQASGMLDALGITSGGVNLDGLDEVMRGVMDLSANYMSTNIATANDQVLNATTFADTATVTVPAGQSWRLIAQGYTAGGFSIGTEVEIAMDMVPGQGGLAVPTIIQQPKRVAATANEAVNSGVLFPMPIVVNSGAAFRAFLRSPSVVGSIDLTLVVAFHRLRTT